MTGRFPALRPAHVWLAAVIVFTLSPLAIVIVNSFNESAVNKWPPTGFTLEWYRRMIDFAGFRQGFLNSLLIGVATTVVTLAAGAMIAYALVRTEFRGKELLRAVAMAPRVVPSVALGFALFVLGVVFGLPSQGSLPVLIVAHVIVCAPFAVMVFVSTLLEIDPITEDAARDLGAGSFDVARLVLWPQLRSGTVIAATFVFLTSFDEVEMTLFLSRPSTYTLPVAMYNYMDTYQDPMVAAVSSTMVFVSAAVAGLGALLLGRRGIGGYGRRLRRED